ncbi:MAG TPA: YhbY family RNA-binding protein, partial [Candidatus Caccousia avistercoris]|nr:YhbY family RNA-binding protein [Candidatus Caccousia avistercoris]
VLTETSPVSPREAAEQLAEAASAEVVQVIGSKFVLFRQKKKDSKIQLPKAERRG